MTTKPNKLKDNAESWQKFLELISGGSSVWKASKELKVREGTFYDLIDADEKKRSEYTKAREIRGDRCLDRIELFQMQLINKELDAPSARVLIDTEKWKACKFYPKMYGEKQEVELSGNINTNINVEIIKSK